MKHVIVIETNLNLREKDCNTIADALNMMIDSDNGGIVCSKWNQINTQPLEIPNATANGETRLADI